MESFATKGEMMKNIIKKTSPVKKDTCEHSTRNYCDPGMLLFLIYFIILFVVLILGKFAFAIPEKDVAGETMSKWGDIRQGTLLLPTSEKDRFRTAPLLSTKVEIKINGMIARTVVRQSFFNNSSEWVEGVYVFPLPDECSVDHLRMKIGERVIVGEIKERAQALAIYNKAKEQGKKATLLEQERPNIFTTSVANVAPGETVEVEIEYQQLVHYADAVFSIRFPMVVGTRYIPGNPIDDTAPEIFNPGKSGWAVNTDEVPDASRITPPVIHPSAGKVNPVKLSVTLSPGFQLASLNSLYHGITRQKDDQGTYAVKFNNRVWADRDFVLEWRPIAQDKPQAALFSEIRNDKAYYLLMVMPPQRKIIAKILPRELVFVLDTSGSMGGASLRQAKEALKLAISRMTSQDRFNIIEFNSTADKLFDTTKQVTPKTVERAVRYINKLEARGGTEIAPALAMALDGRESHDRIRQVIFLTDGCVGNEQDLFALISRRLGDTRLFTVGIGSAPNSFFMTRAAQLGRGTYTYIGKISEIHDKMTGLLQKLENPVFTNLELLVKGKPVNGYPNPIPDLYLGEPLLFSAQLDTIPDHFMLRGMIGGASWSVRLNGRTKKTSDGVAVNWARKKIRFLMDSLSVGADKEKVRQDIIKTALDNHLVSRYTSLVAVEKQRSRLERQGLRKENVPTNLPNGWDYNKVFGGTARTATPSALFLALGVFFLFLSMGVFFYHRIRQW